MCRPSLAKTQGHALPVLSIVFQLVVKMHGRLPPALSASSDSATREPRTRFQWSFIDNIEARKIGGARGGGSWYTPAKEVQEALVIMKGPLQLQGALLNSVDHSHLCVSFIKEEVTREWVLSQ
jgi:hypothetical protein